jgi:large subunit ribosomal protein L25
MLKNTLAQVGRSRPVSLEVEGHETPYITFVRDIQFHPLDSSVLHVDFLSVDVSATIEVEVPIALKGEAPAARVLGGSLIQMLNSVRIQASPLEVPAGISVDVSHLDDFAKSIRVADLQVPAGAAIMTEPDQLVARVTPPVASEVAEVEAVPKEAPEAEPEAEAEGEAGRGARA